MPCRALHAARRRSLAALRRPASTEWRQAGGLLDNAALEERLDVLAPKYDLLPDFDVPNRARLHQPIERAAAEAQVFHRFGFRQQLALGHGDIISRPPKIKKDFSCQTCNESLLYA